MSNCSAELLPLLLLTLPAVVVQAQFNYTTNDGTITVTGYTGPGGAVAIPDTINGLPVTRIEGYAFRYCTGLARVYFQGNAPNVDSSAFFDASNVTVYYLPGTTGWGTTFAGRPAVLWNPLAQTSDASFGVRTNRFGFTITGASNLVIVVEASTNLANAAWAPIRAITLIGGSAYFSDPQWTNHPARFYRFRSP